MRCNQCQAADTKVIESREVADGESIRRRRECIECQTRFTTYERIEKPQLIVVKNDGTRQMYSREKLLAGLYRACEKTAVTSLQIEKLVSEVEQALYACGDSEVPSRRIGEEIIDRLAQIDEVAYVRFASVYRRFKDLASFEKELSKMKQRKD
ncbi:MAG TPA: transcriptional regulator NrdR [Candidatus Saccharibacteria bacterium]|nr:transcriptional regulator NrdR [Candidatus Saccharibacteria bacterium]